MADWYQDTGAPAQGGSLASAPMRSEFALIQAGISDKLPALTGNNNKIIAVNAGATALAAITSIGVAQGGTGATTLTSHGILLGHGASAVSALALGANEMLVGQAGADPVAQFGATLRTTLGLGAGDSPEFANLTLADGLAVGSTFSITADLETLAFFAKNGDVRLYYDNVVKFQTNGVGAVLRTSLSIATPAASPPGVGAFYIYDADFTDVVARIGFLGDLSLYFINEVRGGSVALNVMGAAGAGQAVFAGVADGSAYLYYAGSAKLATTNTGVNVIGTIVVDGLNTTAYGTGGGTATFSATNKPGGSTSPTQWMSVLLNGVPYYVPCWL